MVNVLAKYNPVDATTLQQQVQREQVKQLCVMFQLTILWELNFLTILGTNLIRKAIKPKLIIKKQPIILKMNGLLKVDFKKHLIV